MGRKKINGRMGLIKIVLCAALFSPAAGASSQEKGAKPKVAVLDLKSNGVDENTVSTLTGILLSGLAEGGGIDLLSKSDLTNILNLEQDKLLLGCTPDDPRCVGEHANALGNAILVWGTVGKVGRRLVINVAAVDIQAGTTLGRGSRSVEIDDGEKTIDAVRELAGEMRAALGLPSNTTWSPILAFLISAGVSYGEDNAKGGSINDSLTILEAEGDLFVRNDVVFFLQTGLSIGRGKTADERFTAYSIPITVGIKYRFVRPWVTPYFGAGLGLGFLYLKEHGGELNAEVIAGLEFNPWQRFGFSLETAFRISKSFDTNLELQQIGGKVTAGVIYRF
jgi:hypothetical protein